MPKIRIKDHDRHTGLSIAVVVGAALVVWLAWVLWSSDSTYSVVQRGPGQLKLVYLCDDGHVFEELGATESLPCREPDCQQRAWPVWTFQCSKHGAFVLQLRYALAGDRSHIIKARPPGGDWREVSGEITCLHCERALQPDLSLRRGLLPEAGGVLNQD